VSILFLVSVGVYSPNGVQHTVQNETRINNIFSNNESSELISKKKKISIHPSDSSFLLWYLDRVFLFDEKKKVRYHVKKKPYFYASYPSSDTTSDNTQSFSESDNDSWGTT